MDLNEWRPYRLTEISEVFGVYFSLAKKFTIRMEYSLDEYREQRIQFNFDRLHRAIYHFARFLISIIYLGVMIISRDSESIIGAHFFERMLDVQRIDLMFMFLIIVNVCVEYMWIYTFWEIYQYKSAYNDFIDDQLTNLDENNLEPDNKRKLLNYFIIRGFLMGCVYRAYASLYFSSFLYLLYEYSNLFLADKITFTKMTIALVPYLIFMIQLIFICAQESLVMFCLEFSIKFLKTKFSELCNGTMKRAQYLMNPLTSQFIRNYTELYVKIAKFDKSAQNYFIVAETISKFSLIFITVFYSKQTEFRLFSFSFLIMYMSVQMVINNTFIYSLISFFPTTNLLCYRYLLYCFVSKHHRSIRYHFRHRNQSLIDTKIISFKTNRLLAIKKNLFLQSMPNNKIGFNCGRLFYITQYKNVELFLLNFIFILLFYKKLLLKEL